MTFKQSTADRCSICEQWRTVGDHSKCSELRKQDTDLARLKSKAPRRLSAKQIDRLSFYYQDK